MRVNALLVQLDPVHRDPVSTRAQAEDLIQKAMNSHTQKRKLSLSLIILPEMAFTGYNFLSKEDIKDVAVIGERESTAFAKDMARKYSCGVIIGYTRVESSSDELFNSQMVVRPDGEVVAVYDKSHLYDNDETWATEGSGFKTVDLDWIVKSNGSPVKASLGICMDINPKAFSAPFEAYELANHAKLARADILLFSSAWTTSGPFDPRSMDTINYWARRLQPLLGQSEFFFVCANRIGREANSCWKKGSSGFTTFVGSSCVIDIGKRSLIDFIPGDRTEARLVSFNV